MDWWLTVGVPKLSKSLSLSPNLLDDCISVIAEDDVDEVDAVITYNKHQSPWQYVRSDT